MRFVALILGVLTLWARAGEDPRPNILLIIADDWGQHAGVYGDSVVKTPHFDQLAKDGLLFTHAFCASPSCTPSRGSLLTGRAVHQLEAGGNLWGYLPAKFKSYPDTLEEKGYVIGKAKKSWGPGKHDERPRDPAGANFKAFDAFIKTVPAEKPFCFVLGPSDPHRPYEAGTGAKSGIKPEDVKVPGYFPDTPEVRSDILDYYFEVQRFDAEVGATLKALADAGRAENTLVIVTSDNGMPFPRCKANLYDSGTRMPLVLCWPAKIQSPGRTIPDLVSLTDIAPTVLEAVGLAVPPEMTGKSWMPFVLGTRIAPRERVFVERERHANVRSGNRSYPARAIRTPQHMYIRNLRPELWPAGDPELWHAVGPFGDIDPSPTKKAVITASDPAHPHHRFYQMACAKRPAEELYDIKADPHQINNLAGKPEHAELQAKLRAELETWMKETGDPRAGGETEAFDTYPYYGGPASQEKM